MARHPAFFVLLTGLTATLLFACGGGTTTVTTVRDAGTKTLAENTAQLTVSISNTGVAPRPSTGTGGWDFLAKAGRYTTLTLYGVPGVPDGSQAEAILRLPTVDARPLGAAGQALAKALGIKTPWLALDLRVLSSLQGINFGTIAEASSADPRQFLQFLAGATGPGTKLKVESVAGTSTTHYQVTSDLNVAVKGLTGSDATTLNKDAATYTSSSVLMDVWIDGKGLIRQLVAHLSIKEAAGKPPTAEQVQFTFTGFGGPVDTTPPPANQTTDISGLLKGLAGAAGGG
jgi:hypothetical protein